MQTDTINGVLTSLRNSLRANLSGQDPSPKNRATSDWIFCSSTDEAAEKFGLPYIDETMVGYSGHPNIDHDVSIMNEMRVQYLVRAEKSAHRNTLRDAVQNALTLQNCSHHITWTSIVDGSEDVKKYSPNGQTTIGPRFYVSLLIGTVKFVRNWS